MKTRILFLFTLLCAAIASVQIVHATPITVMNNNDSGAGSLRQALVDANDGDTINFDASVIGTITLITGQLVVNDSITLSGPGANTLAVNGNAASRAFLIAPGKTATISGLTITNGRDGFAGAGIYNSHATLTVSNCTISANSAPYSPGIFNDGTPGGSTATLTINNSSIIGNTASQWAGGIENDGRSGSATLTISNSIISGNSAVIIGGGIYNRGDAGGSATLTVSNSTINGNSVDDYGGGIFNDGYAGSATLTVTNSTISTNSATSNGGGIYNNSGDSGSGATLEIVNSTLSGNSASEGGGIFNDGSLSGSSTLTVNNSTLSGNSVGAGGYGGGIFNYGVSGSATLTLGDTILNAGGSGANIANSSGTVTSLGYNLSSDDASSSLNQTGDQNSIDPMLGPLQDNGGPTFTHALLIGSPAIDKGKNLSGSTTDQRSTGFARTVDDVAIPNASGGDGTDIGAFEVQTSYSAQVRQPINADGSSVFNVRRGVVPVKFTLTLNGVATCDLPPALIAATRTAGGVIGPIDESLYSGPADTGSNFRIDGCQYIYNLSASALGAGTYRLDIIIDSQVVGSATFALR